MNIKRKIDLLKSSIFVLIVMVMFFSNIHSIFVKSSYKVGSNLEEYLIKNLWYKNHFINLYGEILKMGGVFIIDDKDNGYIVKLRNNQITWLSTKSNTEPLVSNILSFEKLLANENIKCLFVQVPGKVSKYEQTLPSGIYDYLNDNQDEVIQQLTNANIDIIDFREELKNDGILMKEAFFNTDHHWKPEIGLWATNKLAQKLEEEFNLPVNWSLIDGNNYNFHQYDNWFLGSIGKQIGTKYAGVDDISLLTPKFETYFSFYIPEADTGREGSYQNALLEYSPHCNIDIKDFFNTNPYEVYTGGNYPHVVITNHNSTNQKKILYIKDSSSNVILPFLAMECSIIDAFDLRYYSNEGSLINYVRLTKPDIVIFATLGGVDNTFFTAGLQQ